MKIAANSHLAPFLLCLLILASSLSLAGDPPPDVKKYFDLYAETTTAIGFGDYKDAIRLIKKMREIAPESGGTFTLEAQALAGLGEVDAAFVALRKGIETNVTFTDMLRSDPGFAPMQEDPRFAQLLARADEITEEFKGSMTTLHRRLDPATASSFASLDEIEESFGRRITDLESRMGMMDYRIYMRRRSELVDEKIASIKKYRAGQEDARLVEAASLEIVRATTEYKSEWLYLGGDAALIEEEARAFLDAHPESEHVPEVDLQRGVAVWLACGPGDREATLESRVERAAPIFKSLRARFPESSEADRALLWSLIVADAAGEATGPLHDRLAPALEADEELADYAWRYGGKTLFQLVGPSKFDAEDIDGNRWNFETMKGKVVLINFWSTWCSPCIADMPHLRDAYARFHERGFEIVGISLDGSKRKALEKALQEKGMVWPQIHDGKGFEGPLASAIRVRGIPTNVLLDREGNVIAFNDESLRGARLLETLSELF